MSKKLSNHETYDLMLKHKEDMNPLVTLRARPNLRVTVICPRRYTVDRDCGDIIAEHKDMPEKAISFNLMVADGHYALCVVKNDIYDDFYVDFQPGITNDNLIVLYSNTVPNSELKDMLTSLED